MHVRLNDIRHEWNDGHSCMRGVAQVSDQTSQPEAIKSNLHQKSPSATRGQGEYTENECNVSFTSPFIVIWLSDTQTDWLCLLMSCAYELARLTAIDANIKRADATLRHHQSSPGDHHKVIHNGQN